MERNIMNRLTKTVLAALPVIVLLSALTSHVADAQVIASGYPRAPWAGSCELGLTVASVSSCSINGVPSMEIVVETVTLQAASDNSYDHVLLSVSTQTGGQSFVWNNQILQSIFNIPEGRSARHAYYSSQPLAMYVDPATTHPSPGPNSIHISIETDGQNQSLGLSGTVWQTGYSVPVAPSAN
jgi:hypothetical protein